MTLHITGKYRSGAPPPEGTRLARNTRLQNRYMTGPNFAQVANLERFAGGRGHTIGELAIAWLLGNPLVGSVIAGASKLEQVTANAKAADWHLTPQDMADIDALLGTRAAAL